MFEPDGEQQIRSLNVEEFKNHLLQKGFKHEITAVLEGQKIDGDCFFHMEATDLDHFGFLFGDKIKLRTYLNAVKSPKSTPYSALEQPPTSNIGQSTAEESLANIETDLAENPSSLIACNKDTKEITINVFGILRADKEGDRILNEYLNRALAKLTEHERQSVLRILVDFLVKYTGTMYPPSVYKEALAKAIVKAFPDQAVRVKGVTPWTHYFNSKTNSYIATRLKYLREQLPANEKQRKRATSVSGSKAGKSATSQSEFDEEKEEALIAHLKDMAVTPSNRLTIFEHMKTSFKYRQYITEKEKKHFKSATSIIQKWPRFVDFHGALLIQEFELLFPSANLSLHRLTAEERDESFVNYYAPRARRAAVLENLRLPCTYDNDLLDAFVSCILLQTNVQKILINSKSVENIVESFIVFKDEAANIDDFVTYKRPPHLSTPFILAIGHPGEIIDLYVVLDSFSIYCGKELPNAFKVLYCCFYAFRLKYPTHLSNLYRFFDEVIFRTTPGVLSPSVGSFVAKLSCISMETVVNSCSGNDNTESETDDLFRDVSKWKIQISAYQV